MSSISRKEGGFGRLLPLVALIVIWALAHATVVSFRGQPVFEGGLLGPDAYMRMVRVIELAQNWQWFDGTIDRANAPYGDTLHWTRPFDVLVILLALPSGLLVGTDQAFQVAGVVVSPLLHLATALLLVWALRPVIRPAVWFLPAVALFLQPGILAYSLPGRADHHVLLLLVFVMAAGFMIRALRNPILSQPALLAGIATGFGVWLSVEFLLVMAACLAGLGLPWLFGERDRAAQNKWYALGLSGMLLIALFVERPLASLLEPSYDRVSCVQYLLAVSIMLFWRMAESFENSGSRPSHLLSRAALAVVGMGAVVLLLDSVFPLFLAGPMAGVDPRILPIWLDRVLEMRPLVPTDRQSLGRFILYLGGAALVAPFFLKALIDSRRSERFFPFAFVAVACLLLTAAAVQHQRFAGYAETAFVFAFTVVLDRVLKSTAQIGNDLLRGLLRGGFAVVMLLGPILVAGNLIADNAAIADADADDSPAGCTVSELADFLTEDPRFGAAPQTVLAFMDIGPELLYRTRHHVIGTPYHRNGDGIFDGHRILATKDAVTARALVRQRGIDLVLLCRSPSERRFYARADGKENLYRRLDDGNPPDWLAPVDLPSGLQDQARLYRVLP